MEVFGAIASTAALCELVAKSLNTITELYTVSTEMAALQVRENITQRPRLTACM